MNCGRCGRPLEQGAAYCGNCGQEVVLPPGYTRQEPSQPPAPPPSTPQMPPQASVEVPSGYTPAAQPAAPAMPAMPSPVAPLPPQAYQQPFPSAQTTGGNGAATASLILGILAFLTGFLLIGGVLGLTAIITGAVGLKNKENKTMCIFGIVLGALGLLCSVVLFVIGFAQGVNEASSIQ